MREIRNSDLVPLEGHPQRWRFAEYTNGYVSPHVERRVRPLGSAAAAEAAQEALRRHPSDAQPRPDALDFEDNGDPASVRAWLGMLPVDPTAPVVVSWDAMSAILTDWELFVLQWDDFCHAAADDVTVWAPGSAWTLCFWHYGVLRFSIVPREG